MHLGETDETLRIRLESRLLSVRWLEGQVAAGGSATLEAVTQYVGHGAPIRITLRDADGNPAGELEGRVLQNLFRARFQPDVAAAGKTLSLEAELPLHGLKLAGGALQVLSKADITALRWLHEGREIAEAESGRIVDLVAALRGAPEGAPAVLSLYVLKANHGATHGRKHGRVLLLQTTVPVRNGEARASWKAGMPGGADEDSIRIQIELERLGLRYYEPRFIFEAACLGLRAVSKDLALASWSGFGAVALPETPAAAPANTAAEAARPTPAQPAPIAARDAAAETGG